LRRTIRNRVGNPRPIVRFPLRRPVPILRRRRVAARRPDPAAAVINRRIERAAGVGDPARDCRLHRMVCGILGAAIRPAARPDVAAAAPCRRRNGRMGRGPDGIMRKG